MADFPSFSLQQRTSQQQRQTQSQVQKLSQQQIMSVKMLAMSSQDLRQEIYNVAARNPALVVTRDAALDGVKDARVSGGSADAVHLGSATQAGKEASDNFQAALESSPDTSETLAEHLEHQFLSVPHSPAEEKIGLALIHNLDNRGFHILDPYSLLDKADSAQTPALLEKVLGYIQLLDPVGTCCRNFEESLFIQAKSSGDAPLAALFILDGHFDFLNPPQTEKILKKANDFLQKNPSSQPLDAQKNIGADNHGPFPAKFSAGDIEQALSYIRRLDPFPASQFSPSDNAYIAPDVYVEKDRETGEYVVRANDEALPVVELSKDFHKYSLDRTRITKSTEESERKRSEHRFVMDSVRSANEFMESLAYRRKTLLLACQQIVRIQKDFFDKGPRFLKPLRQKDIAALIGVHEATVSRMANGKYLRCDRGLFKIGYFFSNAVSQVPAAGAEGGGEGEAVPSSKKAVLYELKQLLDEHKGDKKPLSDQKISDLLSERGIKIARRTVAKYRAQLNIDSSYTR